MKTFHSKRGPFLDQPFFTLKEVETICIDELQKVNLYPSRPEPIRIDRFIEKRFKITLEYIDLPSGILGYTEFGPEGVKAVKVSRSLEENSTEIARRRLNATFAHEAGHGLLHSHLFVLAAAQEKTPVFGEDFDISGQKILCRGENIRATYQYDGCWWEYQANLAIGALLLPRPLVMECLGSILVDQGGLGGKELLMTQREKAAQVLVNVFDVNPVVGRIRIQSIFPIERDRQLTL